MNHFRKPPNNHHQVMLRPRSARGGSRVGSFGTTPWVGGLGAGLGGIGIGWRYFWGTILDGI